MTDRQKNYGAAKEQLCSDAYNALWAVGFMGWIGIVSGLIYLACKLV